MKYCLVTIKMIMTMNRNNRNRTYSLESLQREKRRILRRIDCIEEELEFRAEKVGEVINVATGIAGTIGRYTAWVPFAVSIGKMLIKRFRDRND